MEGLKKKTGTIAILSLLLMCMVLMSSNQKALSGTVNNNNETTFETLYGSADSAANPMGLITININTGGGTSIGPFGTQSLVMGLGFDSKSCILYGTTLVDYPHVNDNSQLLQIDIITGKATAVGGLVGSRVDGLAYDSTNDKLYGSDSLKNNLVAIDISTGQGTVVGPTGFPNLRSLAFNRLDGELYSVDVGTGWLIRIEPSTGIGTFAAYIAPSWEEIRGLSFDSYGTLYGAYQPFNGTSTSLVTIDISTGQITDIGLTGYVNLEALAFITRLITDWNPSRDSYKEVNSGSAWDVGNCYGLSSTEILYFKHYVLGDTAYPYFPAQDPQATWTSDLNLIPTWDTLNNASLAVMFHQVFDHGNVWSPVPMATGYERLKDTLRTGVPALLLVLGVINPGYPGAGEVRCHAVVAYGIYYPGDGTVKIAVSDPNIPRKEGIATYNPNTDRFSYSNGMYSFNAFELLPSYPINAWVWLHNLPIGGYRKDWLQWGLYGYVIVLADKSVTITQRPFSWSPDKFTTMGNSQTFVKGIPGSSGIEEGNLQVYAIPVEGGGLSVGGPFFTVKDPGSNESTILITQVDNESGLGYGYLLNATTTQGLLDYTVAPSSTGLSLSTGDNALNVSVTFFSATEQSYSIYQASSITVDAMQTVNFTVTNWQMLKSVVPSKSVASQGLNISTNVTVANPLDYTETFNVTAYANATSIASQNVTLSGGNSATITFPWNTSGFDYGNYTISAVADTVPGETNTADSNYTGSNIIVTIPGDINGDFKVNLVDLVLLANAYGTTPATGGKPGDRFAWNPNADLTPPWGQIGLSDLVTFAMNYGKTIP